MTSANLMQEAGHPQLVLWDNPEEWVGREVRGDSGWWDTCIPMADSY